VNSAEDLSQVKIALEGFIDDNGAWLGNVLPGRPLGKDSVDGKVASLGEDVWRLGSWDIRQGPDGTTAKFERFHRGGSVAVTVTLRKENGKYMVVRKGAAYWHRASIDNRSFQ
jgi:hypothetical protein